MSRLRRVVEVLSGLIWIGLFVGAGLSLLTQSGGGMYVLAIAMLVAFGWNIYVAWVLITEVSE